MSRCLPIDKISWSWEFCGRYQLAPAAPAEIRLYTVHTDSNIPLPTPEAEANPYMQTVQGALDMMYDKASIRLSIPTKDRDSLE